LDPNESTTDHSFPWNREAIDFESHGSTAETVHQWLFRGEDLPIRAT
jgi:hypothetical protein